MFERINHSITLTQKGHELVACAHQIRTLTDGFKESVENDSQYSGLIHIVTSDSVCEEMINSHYIDFHNKYPDIAIRFTTGDSAVLLDMLGHNEADAIITLDHHLYNKAYSYQMFLEDDIGVNVEVINSQTNKTYNTYKLLSEQG